MTLRTLCGLALAVGLLVSASSLSTAQAPPAKTDSDDPTKKFPEFATFIKGAKEFDGLFKLHLKDDHLYMEIQPQQFDKLLLAPSAVARGAGIGGYTQNFEEQWVVTFRRVGDKVFFIRKNVRFLGKPGSPAARAVETTYNDSVLAALPIRTINPARGSVVVDLNQIFFTDFAQIGLGSIDQSRTTWHKVKAFKKNIELQVAATFVGGGAGDAVIDRRGTTVIVHYGLVEMPDIGYSPRLADDRVGHFTTVVKDFSSENSDTAFVRYVNRWRLERVDGSSWKEGGKLVPPKKKIIFWIENTVPDEYRAAVREGILEWNKAFEKIGFRDAIEVRQQEGEEFEPEDVTYNTFRWIATDRGFAMGPSRANPLTGELLDADIIFDASMVRAYKAESKLFRNEAGQVVEPASIMQATRRGWGLNSHPLAWNHQPLPKDPEARLKMQAEAIRSGFCQCAAHKATELGLAASVLAIRAAAVDGEKIPEELLQQAVKEVTMHEVGHTLGLRHNFKASTVLKNEQLHDTSITRKEGLVGSVMDYAPVNLAPKGVKQGDYFTTTLGAYDYWAIEYAYRPLGGGTQGEASELNKIANKVASPKLIYATDEDLYGTSDPLVNVWDLGADPMKFAQDRIKIAEELIPKIADKVVDDGEGYQRARVALGVMLRQYGDAAYMVSKFVGGVSMHRDHKGDPDARDAFIPTSPAKQREGLKFLQQHILADKVTVPPEVLRKLGADRWLHWGNDRAMTASEFPLNQRILGIQEVVLDELLDASTLSRLQNIARMGAKGEEPLQISEVFRTLTDSAFADLPADGKATDVKSSLVLRNLQRAYLTRLSNMVLGPKSGGNFIIFLGGGSGSSVPPDARSLARLHLKEIQKRIDAGLKADGKGLDDTTRAHLEEAKEQIAKVLDASLTVNEP